MWLEGGSRRWDLIVAYYGDNEREFAELRRVSNYAFRTKGGKFQNLKKFVAQQPSFFEQYSYIWVCDDDMRMSVAQIDEAFAITERLGFWVAQPAFHPEGNNYHTINVYAGSQCDYRTVNYIENNVPIFRRDKLVEFLAIYDGSLPAEGVDYWYMNVFGANKLGRWNLFASLIRPSGLRRFAVIDKVQVINPHNKEKKGGREVDRFGPWSLRKAEWGEAMKKYGFVKFPHRAFVCRKIGDYNTRSVVTRYDVVKLIAATLVRRLRWLNARSLNVLFGH
jgi:hypothetical protein